MRYLAIQLLADPRNIHSPLQNWWSLEYNGGCVLSNVTDGTVLGLFTLARKLFWPRLLCEVDHFGLLLAWVRPIQACWEWDLESCQTIATERHRTLSKYFAAYGVYEVEPCLLERWCLAYFSYIFEQKGASLPSKWFFRNDTNQFPLL